MAGKETNLNSKSYDDALKKVKELYSNHEKLNKKLEEMKTTWGSISSTVLGISGSDWYEKVAKSTEDIAKQNKAYTEASDQLKNMGIALNNSVESMSKLSNSAKKVSITINKSQIETNLFNKLSKDFDGKQLKNKQEIEDISKKMMQMALEKKKLTAKDLEAMGVEKGMASSLLETHKDIVEQLNKKTIMPKQLEFLNVLGSEHLKQKYAQYIAENNIAGLIEEEGMQAALILSTSGEINDELKAGMVLHANSTKKVKEMAAAMRETEKTQFSLIKGLKSWGANLTTSVLKKITEFDNEIHDAQKNMGIMFTQNSAAMTDLTIKTARFGMSIKDTAVLMGVMSDTLNNTNFGLLAGAAEDLMMIQLATGMSAESLGTMAGEMMRMGSSSAEVKENIIEINSAAKMFGVNSKKALESISKNFTRFRTMGFQGGIDSLKKMTVLALRLGQNIDEIFDMAKKARNIEGAMEMAAELQLAGGSFANINPMDLLSAARKGPQELQKILGKMGSDIGKFDEKTGKMTFDPVDVDRLQIVANATGETIEGIQNRLMKMKQDNAKMNLMPDLKFDGLKDAAGNPIDPEGIKNLLSDSVNMSGKVLEGSLLDKEGIKDLSKLSQGELDKIMKKKAADDANLEEQAKQNQSLQASFEALKGAFLNIFTKLQPVIEWLTKVLQGISSIFSNSFVKWGVLAVALTVFAYRAVPSLVASLGSMWTGGRGMIAGIGRAFKAPLSSMKALFAKGMVSKGAGGGIAPTLPNAGGAKAGGGGIVGLSESLAKASKIGARIDKVGIKRLALAMVAILAPLAGIALIFGLLGGDPMILLALGLAVIELATALWIVSKLGKGVQLSGIIQLAIGMAIIGLAMIPFAFAASLMTGVDWVSVLIGVGLLTLIVIGLGLLGTFMLPLMPGLILMGIGMLLVSASLFLFGKSLIPLTEGLKVLATVPWDSFGGMFSALVKVAGGLMAFGFAGLVFLNPLMMIGMMSMIGTLMLISMILSPLAESLELGSEGLNGMAQGVLKLSDSLAKLDFEKLEKLKEFSENMVDAAAGGSIAEAMGKLADAMGNVGGGKSGGGEENKTITVNLMLPNGGVLQQVIADYNNK